MPNGKTLSVKIPDHVEDGQQIRLKGQGPPPRSAARPGDALVTLKFERHRQFRRDGKDLRVDVPITLYEAVLGAKVRVPTLDGSVELNLPPGVDTGKSLRLKGKGLYGDGDLYASLRIELPRWRRPRPRKPDALLARPEAVQGPRLTGHTPGERKPPPARPAMSKNSTCRRESSGMARLRPRSG